MLYVHWKLIGTAVQPSALSPCAVRSLKRTVNLGFRGKYFSANYPVSWHSLLLRRRCSSGQPAFQHRRVSQRIPRFPQCPLGPSCFHKRKCKQNARKAWNSCRWPRTRSCWVGKIFRAPLFFRHRRAAGRTRQWEQIRRRHLLRLQAIRCSFWNWDRTFSGQLPNRLASLVLLRYPTRLRPIC